MNVNQLMVKLTTSAEQHDENTGEDNGDLVQLLRMALEQLDSAGQLPQFIETLSQSDFPEVWEYDWLKPNESYVRVENSAATLELFDACKRRGYILAAGTIQNEGNIPLVDMEKALTSIADLDLYGQYNQYIRVRTICGKDAD